MGTGVAWDHRRETATPSSQKWSRYVTLEALFYPDESEAARAPIEEYMHIMRDPQKNEACAVRE